MKKDEYSKNQTESVEQVKHTLPKEYFEQNLTDHPKVVKEYFDVTDEFVSNPERDRVSVHRTDIVEAEKRKKKQHRNLMRNMVYVVASAATVAVLTQTAEPDKVMPNSYLAKIIYTEKDTSERVDTENNTEISKKRRENRNDGNRYIL